MNDDKKTHKNIAPYIPFKTLTGFVSNLKNHAVPPLIDHSLLQTMSGSMRGQLLSTLRYLNLIDLNNAVNEPLIKMVKAYKTDSYGEVLHEILRKAYHDIFENVNLESGTSQTLIDAFRKHGNVDGQMLDKAIRFFLTALDECSVKYSPYFKIKKARKPTQRKKKKTKLDGENNGEDSKGGEDFDIDDIDDRAQFRIAIPGKKDVVIFLPDDIDQDDWDMVKIMLDAYVKRLTKSGGR